MIVLRNRSFAITCPNKIMLPNGIEIIKGNSREFHKILRKYIQPIREKPEDFVYYNVMKDGNNIGSLHLRKLGKDSMEVAWIDINQNHRGNKYATKIMEWCISLAKEQGYRSVELEVPGNAPDARHIYEKLGFRETGDVREQDNSSWDGLNKMILKI